MADREDIIERLRAIENNNSILGQITANTALREDIVDYIESKIREAAAKGYEEACRDNPQRGSGIIEKAKREARVETARKFLHCNNWKLAREIIKANE